MATVGSMYEEKLSPNNKPKICVEEIAKDTGIDNKKSGCDDPSYNRNKGEEGPKDDAVLDEIAAKVNEMGFNDADSNHEKCMDTVRSQGETINTLINQLRIMFEEYTSINNEREYYEELNEALFRCLELNEGTAVLESEEEEESVGSSNETGGTVEKPSEIHTDSPKSAAISETNIKDDKNNSTTTETKEKTTMKKKELIDINELLRREIFELRHEMEVLKESFRDYLNSEDMSQESELDTDTDDENEHMDECSQCRESADLVPSEDYQYLENDQVEIANESDSD